MTAIDKSVGVAQSIGHGKAKAVRHLLIHPLDSSWTLPSRLDNNPLVWMLQIDGSLVDIRRAPREAQEAAVEKGLIPYIPQDRAEPAADLAICWIPMTARKRIKPGEQIVLELSQAEHAHLLQDVQYLDPELEVILRRTAPGEPVQLTLDELDLLTECVAAAATHAGNRRRAEDLDRIFDRIDHLLAIYTDEPDPPTLNMEQAKRAKVIADELVFAAEWGAQVLVASRQLRMHKEPVERLCLAPAQRAYIATLAALPNNLRDRLKKEGSVFTVSEVTSMLMAVAEELGASDGAKQQSALVVVEYLGECLQGTLNSLAKRRSAKASARPQRNKTLFQFKITLLETSPTVWRRMQTSDCTLDELHHLIQVAMGWTNSHLHQFEIDGQRYGAPELLDDGVEDIDFKDSTTTSLHDVLPARGERFRFRYEYDFGDGWEHDIVFEGCPSPAKGARYPLCLEGERACPPEDVGGVVGYQEFLEAIADSDHEQHEELLAWIGGTFDPNELDLAGINKRLKKLR